MKGFSGNIEELTLANNNFRQVLYTAKHCQLVLMSLPIGGEIGSEIHEENDQFFRFESGEGKVLMAMNILFPTVVRLLCRRVLSIM